MKFDTLEQIVASAANIIRPPERLTVSQAAEKYRKLNNPGSYVGPWDNSIAPYLVEPMDVLTSLDYTGMVFAGPARCGKSDMYFNWLTHSGVCDPADMMVVHMTQATARDWSQGDLARVFRHSPSIGKKVAPGRQNRNVHDVRFSDGTRLLVKWPTITELSGKTIPRLWLMDYDRMPEDVDKEGTPFDLARKRAQTFMRYGMCAAESSPGFMIENPRWMPSSPHEAPPTKGILALYNRGDRRRWYWRCPHCNTAFEPDFHLLHYPESADPMEAAEAAQMVCPICGCFIPHTRKDGIPGKHELNLGGRWLKDGQTWDADGNIVGLGPRSDIASFWLKGVCAAFADWKTLVLRYLTAMREYESTGSQEALKGTVNTDQGLPFSPIGLNEGRLPETLKARAKEVGERVVPAGVRFLVATIDIQKNKFVVQVHGFGVGGDIWIIDRFDVKKSERTDEDGERLWVRPGAYLEDWKLLVKEVILKTYPLDDDSGRQMKIMRVGCDSGGEEGVTSKAYSFWRWLRDGEDDDLLNEKFGWEPGLHSRFILIKPQPRKDAPRVRIAFPDSERKDRKAAARGEVPILEPNSNILKDSVDHMLERVIPGGGMVNFPKWLPDWWFSELTVEVKTIKGWENKRGRRNEAWDLLYYALAVALIRPINLERINWDDPPSWADEWEVNDLVFEEGFNKPFESQSKEDYDLSSLAASLA